jgi:hypothetical protein
MLLNMATVQNLCLLQYVFPAILFNIIIYFQVRFIRRHGKGIFLVDELEYFEQYYVSCGGFTSINFGNRNPAHYQSKSVKELQVRVSYGFCCFFLELASRLDISLRK